MKTRNTVVDSLSGEVISDTVETVKKVAPDEFMQVYLQDLSGLMRISKRSEIIILIWLWRDSSYMAVDEQYLGNKVVVNKQLIDLIIKGAKAENYSLTSGTIRNTITALVKKGLIVKDKTYRGTYYLNPEYFFKGKITDRSATLSFTRTYEIGEESFED